VPLTGSVFAYYLAIAGNRLYWANDWEGGDVQSCGLPDCAGGPSGAAGTSTGSIHYYNALVADPAGTTIFWAAANSNDPLTSMKVIGAMPVGTGTIRPLLSGVGSYAMAADNSYLYFANSGTKAIEKITFAGGSRATVAMSPTGVGALAACGVHLYWTDSVNVYAIPLPNGTGTATVPAFSVGQTIAGLACDDSGVYWTNSVSDAGTVVMCPHTGCGIAPKVIALGQNRPMRIALDGPAVYWVTFSGALLKVAK
jgi:hypothetical protein